MWYALKMLMLFPFSKSLLLFLCRYLKTAQLFCDCKLSWLPLWLWAKGFRPSVYALCLHPKPVERKSIFNLSSSDFVCGKL